MLFIQKRTSLPIRQSVTNNFYNFRLPYSNKTLGKNKLERLALASIFLLVQSWLRPETTRVEQPNYRRCLSLSFKSKITIKNLAMDKHSSLVCFTVKDKEKVLKDWLKESVS